MGGAREAHQLRQHRLGISLPGDRLPLSEVPALAARAEALGYTDFWSFEVNLFDGFTPLPSYPEYSADFFDGDHFVIKGASPVTARGLIRPGFRNWFRPRYPYIYAAFRCVKTR